MFQEEVLIAPLLVFRIILVAVRCEGILVDLVEVADVFLEGVIGREIHPAAEPERIVLFAAGQGRGDDTAPGGGHRLDRTGIRIRTESPPVQK